MAFTDLPMESQLPEVPDEAFESLGVELEAPHAEPAGYEANENLVPMLPPEFVKALGRRVVEDAKRDKDSSEGWREQSASFLALYDNTSKGEDMIENQPNITPLRFPFFTRAVQVFKSKLFAHLFPDDRELVGIAATGPETDEEDARRSRCATHMNSQLQNVVTDYRKACDRNMDRFLIEGCIFEVWYYDPVAKKPAHRFVRADDMIVPYKHEFLRWDMSDFPRLSWVKRYYRHELEAEEEAGYYTGVTTGEKPLYKDGYEPGGVSKREEMSSDLDAAPSTQVDDKVTGQDAPDDGDEQREILEQDRYVKLPGEPKNRLCTVCVDQNSGAVLRVALCERPDEDDAERVAYETANHEAATQQHAEQMDQHMGTAAQMMALGMPPPEAPQPPAPPAPQKMVPWHRWTSYCCFENPGGAYGHGIGHRVAAFNITANKLATRAMALMTMNLLPTGFFSKQAKPTGSGDLVMSLGMMVESALTPDQVSAGAGMKVFQFPPPDPNWFRVISQLDESVQELTAYNIASGGQGLSGDTATTTEIRNSNATDTISTVAIRYNAARAASLRNLAYLNSQTLPEEGVMVGGERVTREDYALLLRDIRVVFSCDPRVESASTRERRAMKVLQTVTQILSTPVSGNVPLLDPATSAALLRAVGVSALKELGVKQSLLDQIENAPLPAAPGEPPPGGAPGTPPEGEPPREGPPGGTPPTQGPLQGEDVNGQPSQVGMDQSSGDRPVHGPLG